MKSVFVVAVYTLYVDAAVVLVRYVLIRACVELSIVHLLAIVQNIERCTVHVLK